MTMLESLFSCNLGVICSLFYLIVLIGIIFLFDILFLPPIRRKVAKTETELDDKIVSLLTYPTYTLIVIIAAYYLFLPYIPNKDLFYRLVFTFVAIYIAWVVSKLIDTFVLLLVDKSKMTKRSKEEFKKTAFPLIVKVIYIGVFSIVVMIVLDKWGINIIPLITSAGLIGVGLGFALKDILENTISGIIIIFDKPFKVGDILELENGLVGRVVEISIRTTKIERFNKDIIIVPNSQLLNSKVINYNKPDNVVRVDVKVAVAYGSNVEKVKKILLNTTKKIKEILQDPAPFVWFLEMGDFSLDFKVFFYTTLQDKMTARDKYLTIVYKELEKNGINIPFPTHTVYLKKGGKK